jgi:hypothetical protein
MRHQVNTAIRFLEMAKTQDSTTGALECVELAREELTADPVQTGEYRGVLEALGYMVLIDQNIERDLDFTLDLLTGAICALGKHTW